MPTHTDSVTVSSDPSTPCQWIVESTQWLPISKEELFPFFAEAHNLQEITPKWLDFRVVEDRGSIDITEGTKINYRLKVRFARLKWLSLISDWNPPHSFVDQQIKGPYRKWHHTHTFEDHEGGTLCTDRVVYQVPGGIFSPIVNALFVKRDVLAIFRYRQKVLKEKFSEKA